MDKEKIINTISPSKDVDGFNPNNVGNLASGYKSIIPCTPLGCLLLIKKNRKKSYWYARSNNWQIKFKWQAYGPIIVKRELYCHNCSL